jgi:tetratricopeptide (TPR) repeat protein
MRRLAEKLLENGVLLRLAGVLTIVTLLEAQPAPLTLVEAHNTAAQATQVGDYETATQAYHTAHDYAPWDITYLTGAAQAELLWGDDEAVLRDLDALQQKRPLTAEEHLLLGHVLANRGDFDGAREAWRIAVEGGVGDTDAYLSLIEWHLSHEEWDTAARLLAELAERNPDDASAHYRLGLVLALQDPAQARIELDAAAVLEPELGNRTALLSGLLGNESSHDPAFFKAQLGIIYLELEEWALAEAAFEQAITFNPGYGEAVAYLGYARAQRGELESALPAFQQAAAISPDSPIVHYLTGLYWKQAQSWPEARAAFERAYERDQDNPGLAVEIANTHRAENRPLWAEVWMLDAVRLAEDDERVLIALAQFYVDDEYRVDTAGIAAARKAVLEAPDNGAAHDALGWAYFLLGDLSAAHEELQQALLLDPSLTRAYFHMGTLLELRGNRNAAIEAYRTAARLEPEGAFGVRSQRALERLGTG